MAEAEGCRARVTSDATEAASEKASVAATGFAGADSFMFPSALKAQDLQSKDKSDDEEDESEDTDAPAGKGVMSSIYDAKIFTDPEEQEKWKARGWRAVQCCGGALLVLALIFDEMD
eukprot:TRINITY_DN84152_c0_g1_i1.p1 TRINITY_DN84152_c0_g1~~TRINITY_DN84152_c0_g1_i1.p1  ORF type:complete len:129 (-),score=44.63 TRINITY_DN84152_c0_g1_i1:33-383(-)